MLAFLALFVLAWAQPPNPPAPDTYYIWVPFDHTNPDDNRTFQLTVLVYDKYFTGNGPIFFCAGGEAPVRGGYDHNGFMFETGQPLGAFMLFPEHRFYGQSLPFGLNSYTPDRITKLTIEQAMADYILVIEWAKKKWNIDDTTPLISFGGSYPGDLTAYLRVAYPDIIDAGMASSAPLRYHAGMVAGGAFFQVCTQDFGRKDPRCPALVQTAFNQILALAATPEGRIEITTKLQLCGALEPGPAPLRLLALWIENAFATLGMENYPYPLYGLPAWPAEYACSVMLSIQDPIVALSQTVGVVYNSSAPWIPCFNISEEYYPCADITGCGGGVGDPDAMSWDYQSCTEIVSNVDTNNVTDPFPPAPYDFDALVAYCKKTWNAVPNPTYIPMKYDYKNATRLILSSGSYDPWYPGGVLPSDCPRNQDINCFLIDKAAHHLDLRGSDPKNDPPSVVTARRQEASIITRWVTTIRKEKQMKKAMLRNRLNTQ